MLDYVLSIAAFAVVAFVLVFVHPASQAGRAAAQQMAAPGGMTTAVAAATHAIPRLAASK